MTPVRSTSFLRRRAANPKEQLIHVLLLCCALVSILTTLGIVVVLVRSAVYNPGEKTAFFEEVSVWEIPHGYSLETRRTIGAAAGG